MLWIDYGKCAFLSADHRISFQTRAFDWIFFSKYVAGEAYVWNTAPYNLYSLTRGGGFNITVAYIVNFFRNESKACSNISLTTSCIEPKIISWVDFTRDHFYCYWHSSFSNRMFVTVAGVDCSQDIDECEAMPCLNNGEITVCLPCIWTHCYTNLRW